MIMADAPEDPAELADLISIEYELGEPLRIEPLQISRNHTYRVTTALGDYALRIRGDSWWIHDESELRFELELLDHLAAGGIAVSTAISRRNGDQLGVLDDRQGPRWYSLFTWAPGTPGAKTPQGAALVGRTLAGIHTTADELTPTHPRHHLDQATMLDRRLPAIEASFPTDRPEDVRLIREQIAEIRDRLRTFDPGPGGWGIIHGDVQELNFHIDDGRLTFIDFDLCAWGWRTADIAEYYTRIPPPHREPFLDGYQSIRPLNPAERDMLLTIARLAWIREGCTSHTLAQMLRDPFVRFRRTDTGRWQMTSPT
jgi:Ser/Thr protein kinase RdoA (MazF antagonist)